MKILAFNGSPKGTKSNTDIILQPFLQGASQAGADTETVDSVRFTPLYLYCHRFNEEL